MVYEPIARENGPELEARNPAARRPGSLTSTVPCATADLGAAPALVACGEDAGFLLDLLIGR